MSGSISLEVAMRDHMPLGKDPGWWRLAHRKRISEEIEEIVQKWYSNPNQSVPVEDYVLERIGLHGIILADMGKDEFCNIIEDAIYKCIGLERPRREK